MPSIQVAELCHMNRSTLKLDDFLRRGTNRATLFFCCFRVSFLHDHLTVIQAYSLAYQRRGNLELAKLGLRGVTVLAASGDTGIQGAAQQGGPPPRCAPFAAAPRHSKDGYDCFFGQLGDRFFKDQFVFMVS